MTNEQTSTLVLKDMWGTYFLVSRETLDRGRVPKERKGEVERLIAESLDGRSIEGEDARGYLGPIAFFLIVCAEIAAGAAVAIGLTGPEVGGSPPGGPGEWRGRMQ